MLRVVDDNGRRDVSDAELSKFRAGADSHFQAFWDALEWRPITDYDRDAAPPVIVRDGQNNWEFAAWDTRHRFPYEDAGHDDETPMWRQCQELWAGQPIEFEPRWFASVSDNWAVVLTAD